MQKKPNDWKLSAPQVSEKKNTHTHTQILKRNNNLSEVSK